MNNLDTRRYEMLVRVREFGSSNLDLFPSASAGGKAFGDVAAAIQDLKTCAADHVSGRGSAREGATSKAVARGALREDIEAIARTARAMALDTPGLEDRFRPPRGSGDQALLNTARAFARNAADLEAAFITYSLPEDFIEDLIHGIEDLEDACRDRHAGTDAHVAARAAFDTAMAKALGALRRLDAAVPNRLGRDAGKLAVWTRIRRMAPQPKPRNRATTAVQPATLTPLAGDGYTDGKRATPAMNPN